MFSEAYSFLGGSAYVSIKTEYRCATPSSSSLTAMGSRYVPFQPQPSPQGDVGRLTYVGFEQGHTMPFQRELNIAQPRRVDHP